MRFIAPSSMARCIGLCADERRTTRCNQTGIVVIEFILVLPLLLFMVGYTFRLTQLLQANQIAMTFSREAATEAFRRCTDVSILTKSTLAKPCPNGAEICVDLQATGDIAQNCLTQIKNKYQVLWPVARPSGNSDNAIVDLDIYRYDIQNLRIPANCTGAAGQVTTITTGTVLDALPISAESLCRRNRIARARIRFTVSPTAAFLTLVPGVVRTSFEVIDETVL
jgi:hypothetical protein